MGTVVPFPARSERIVEPPLSRIVACTFVMSCYREGWALYGDKPLLEIDPDGSAWLSIMSASDRRRRLVNRRVREEDVERVREMIERGTR